MFGTYLLDALLADGQGGKVGESFHHPTILAVEGFGSFVGHDEDSSLGFAIVPWQKESVGDGGASTPRISKNLGNTRMRWGDPRSRQMPQALGYLGSMALAKPL